MEKRFLLSSMGGLAALAALAAPLKLGPATALADGEEEEDEDEEDDDERRGARWRPEALNVRLAPGVSRTVRVELRAGGAQAGALFVSPTLRPFVTAPAQVSVAAAGRVDLVLTMPEDAADGDEARGSLFLVVDGARTGRALRVQVRARRADDEEEDEEEAETAPGDARATRTPGASATSGSASTTASGSRTPTATRTPAAPAASRTPTRTPAPSRTAGPTRTPRPGENKDEDDD
ncbi:MAG TPA: hypothetical protein VFN74_03685 [Chloroflexota bacterium]|nr:hypothetical protein [Chloroflexota bacterium]